MEKKHLSKGDKITNNVTWGEIKTAKLTEFPNFVATATKLSKQKKRIWRWPKRERVDKSVSSQFSLLVCQTVSHLVGN